MLWGPGASIKTMASKRRMLFSLKSRAGGRQNFGRRTTNSSEPHFLFIPLCSTCVCSPSSNVGVPIAGLILSTEALVAEHPEKTPPMPAAGGGGGMPGMGGTGGF